MKKETADLYFQKAMDAAFDHGVIQGRLTAWLREGKITRNDIELLNRLLKTPVKVITDK